MCITLLSDDGALTVAFCIDTFLVGETCCCRCCCITDVCVNCVVCTVGCKLLELENVGENPDGGKDAMALVEVLCFAVSLLLSKD